MTGRGHAHADEGFSLVETMVAVVILAVSILAVTQSFMYAMRSMASTRSRSEAVNLADSYLQQASAFGCGIAIGATAQPGTSSACGPDPTASTDDNVGDADFVLLADGAPVPAHETHSPPTVVNSTPVPGITFTVKRRSTWVQFNAAGSHECGIDLTRPPEGIVRDIEITWDGWNNGVSSHRVRTFEALPPEDAAYNDASRGSVLVVTGEPHRQVRADITGPLGVGEEVMRLTDENGCAWFPFLPVNTSVQIDGGAPITITTPGEHREVTAP